METIVYLHYSHPSSSFLPYLWGMETLKGLLDNGSDDGSYRTYEEWKLVKVFRMGYLSPSSYRTYEEWKLLSLQLCWQVTPVLTVPMRNGNTTYTFTVPFFNMSVLTVPMRNGNSVSQSKQSNGGWFLPYLWGMETIKVIFDGEMFYKFLPYLWGMETRKAKHSKWNRVLGSYRTYEEWKRATRNCKVMLPLRSYRTYEEWKPLLPTHTSSIAMLVLTVPMRNGNFFA